MPLPIEYNIAIENAGQPDVLVDWGNAPGWVERYRERLDAADRISLIPKNGQALPTVTVTLGGDRRWVAFSRVCGIVNGDKRIRLYAVGWQQTVRGVNIKSLTWVYPTGAIEHAEQPSFINQFLRQ